MFFHSILDKEKKYEKKMESFTSNKKLSSSLCCTKTKESREKKLKTFFLCGGNCFTIHAVSEQKKISK